jgi:hypothetical protein
MRPPFPKSRVISRQVAELAVQHGFELRAEHISGAGNVRADSLSRRLAAAEDRQLRLKPGVFEGADFPRCVSCCMGRAGYGCLRCSACDGRQQLALLSLP